mmetsp:Transcript_8541/g.29351  ORF Transcript_8541/g.29351 Transcript_8541/m.29351 type:complete len:255 (-) Transcript_8541:323-1087(-)
MHVRHRPPRLARVKPPLRRRRVRRHLAHEVVQLDHVGQLVWLDQRNGHARPALARRAAGAVDEESGRGGERVVYDVVDHGHVQAARGHVRHDEQRRRARAEGVQVLRARLLVHGAVDARRLPFRERRLSDGEEQLAMVPRRDEDDGHLLWVVEDLAQHGAQRGGFLVGPRHKECQPQRIRQLGLGLQADNLAVVAQARARELRQRARHRRRKQQRLPLGSHGVQQRPQLLREPHLEEPVRFVEDCHARVRQRQQ